jgi:hypothetical protein
MDFNLEKHLARREQEKINEFRKLLPNGYKIVKDPS